MKGTIQPVPVAHIGRLTEVLLLLDLRDLRRRGIHPGQRQGGVPSHEDLEEKGHQCDQEDHRNEAQEASSYDVEHVSPPRDIAGLEPVLIADRRDIVVPGKPSALSSDKVTLSSI